MFKELLAGAWEARTLVPQLAVEVDKLREDVDKLLAASATPVADWRDEAQSQSPTYDWQAEVDAEAEKPVEPIVAQTATTSYDWTAEDNASNVWPTQVEPDEDKPKREKTAKSKASKGTTY